MVGKRSGVSSTVLQQKEHCCYPCSRHWTQKQYASILGSDETITDTLEPRPWLWSIRDVGKAFAVSKCCQFCRSPRVSFLPKALRTLQTSMLTVNLWWSPVLGDRRLQAAFKKMISGRCRCSCAVCLSERQRPIQPVPAYLLLRKEKGGKPALAQKRGAILSLQDSLKCAAFQSSAVTHIWRETS